MARRYSINGQDTNTDETTILGLVSTAAIRPRIYFVSCQGYGTPNDYQAQYVVNRTTTTGTSTSVTPQALDPGDPAAIATAGMAHSAEPTYTAGAVLLVIGRNMRPVYQWTAMPGREIVLPATANNGVGVLVKEVSTVWSENVCIHFEE